MNAEQKQQLQRDAAQFERLKNSVAELAALERQEQEQSRELELDDRIGDLSAKLYNDCSNFQRLKSENDKKLLSLLWDLRTILTDRISLSKRVGEISNIAEHLAYRRMVKSGNLPDDFGGQKIELQMATEQLLMNESGLPDSSLMRIEIQQDEVIDSLLQTIARFTNDCLINKVIQKPSAFVQSQDGVHWIDIPVKEELEG